MSEEWVVCALKKRGDWRCKRFKKEKRAREFADIVNSRSDVTKVTIERQSGDGVTISKEEL